MSRFPEPSLQKLTLPLAVALSIGVAALLPTNYRLENALNRALPQRPDPQTVLVAIDDASLHDYGRLDQWPRELYAAALKTLSEAGARVVGLDVLLSDPGPNDRVLDLPLSRPNVVLAADPTDPFGRYAPMWASPRGVSALNSPHAGGISEFQTAYRVAADAPLAPSFAGQVAVAAGVKVPLSTAPVILPYIPQESLMAGAISFRDIVNGNVRYAALQDKVVLVGLTASGLSASTLPDIDGRTVPGVMLQSRAVSALLGRPFTRVPQWLTMLLCALTAGLVIRTRQLWGFVIASLALLVSVPFWLSGISLPGVTISFAAIIATALVALERWWSLRRISTQDPMTGFGNRLAFTRAVEHRWPGRQSKPFGLVLIEVDELRRVADRFGRSSNEEVMRDLAERLQRLKRRSDVVFRWGSEEFAVMLDHTSATELPDLIAYYQQQLSGLHYRDLPLVVNIGAAATQADMQTPTDLMEVASRNRYRMKYQREQHAFGLQGS